MAGKSPLSGLYLHLVASSSFWAPLKLALVIEKSMSKRPHSLKTLKIARSVLGVFLFPAAVFLAACSTQPVIVDQTPEPEAEALLPVIVEDRPFETDTLYALLVAEMAGDRHRFDIMLNNYTQQANATRDPGVISRAARIARYLKSHPVALEMALMWVEQDPYNTEARYIAAAELVHANRLVEAVPHAKILIDNDETSGFDAIGARAQQGGDIAITEELISEFEPLVTRYPNHAPLRIGISLLYQHAGKLEKALENTRVAIELEPEDFQALAQETRLLQQLGRNKEALDKLAQLVSQHPDNHQLKLQYARNLLQSDLSGAQEQFEQLLEDAPNNPELTLTLALIKHERGLLDEAAVLLGQLTENPRHSSTAYFYLGQIEFTHKNFTQAITHLSKVGAGKNYLPAVSLISDIFIAQGQLDKAIALIQDQRRHSPPERLKQIEGLYMLEAQILSAQGQYLEAIALLEEGIGRVPESTALIYNRGMLYTRIDEIARAEADLRRVLAITPENAAALNALGYTLADRTDRLEEAYAFIQKAYLLAPEDPAVIDSLGWVEFRRGNLQTALKTLEQAMKAMPDHEIAAHLGEVLWTLGKTNRAKEIWAEGLKLNPQSEVIRSTMQRLNAPPNE